MRASDLINKKDSTNLELCILWVLDDAYERGYGTNTKNLAAKILADDAAEELARLKRVERAAEKVCEYKPIGISKVIDDLHAVLQPKSKQE